MLAPDPSPNITHDFLPVLQTRSFSEIVAGELFLPTGSIVCGDPFFLDGVRPFKEKVDPGRYPVIISIYKVEEGHHRIAFGRIRFSDIPAVRWQLAFMDDVTDEQIASIEPGEFYGYGVDAGLACFTDATSMELFDKSMDDFYKNHPVKNYYTDVLAPEFKVSSGDHPLSVPEGTWNNHFPVKGDDRNVVMFSSGWGDGTYPVYWGLDASGNITEMVTDFGVVGYDQ